MCVRVFVCVRFSGAGPSFPSAWVFHLQSSQNALHPVGWQGRPNNTMHTPRCRGRRPDVYIFLFFFFFQCFVLVLKRLRGSGQLGHFHVDHDAGGAECDGAEGCLLVSHVSLSVINTSWVMWLRDSAGRFALTEGFKTWWPSCTKKVIFKPWFGILQRVVTELTIESGFLSLLLQLLICFLLCFEQSI